VGPSSGREEANVPHRDGELGLALGLQTQWTLDTFDLMERDASLTFKFVAALGVGP
jgi:hypothetical protein